MTEQGENQNQTSSQMPDQHALIKRIAKIAGIGVVIGGISSGDTSNLHHKQNTNDKEIPPSKVGTPFVYENSQLTPTPEHALKPLPTEAPILSGSAFSTAVAETQKFETAEKRIRQFEQAIGDKRLSFEQAKTLAANIVDFYIESSDSSLSKDEILSRIIFIRPPVGKRAFNENGLDLSQLLIDYPNIQITPQQLKAIQSAPLAYGLRSEDNYIFLSLDNINDNIVNVITTSPLLQYTSDDHGISSQPLTPAVQMRSTLLHELTHYDLEMNRALKPIDKDIFVDLMNKGILPAETKTAQVENFSVVFNSPPSCGTCISGLTDLKEFFTDARAIHLSKTYSLPYAISYGTIDDFNNFDIIMKQAGLSFQDLERMDREGDLKEFYIRIAQGAKSIKFASQAEMLKFGITILPPKNGAAFINQRWGDASFPIEKYFPGVKREK